VRREWPMRGTSVLRRDMRDEPDRGMNITPTAIGGALAGGTLAGLLIEPLGWAVLAAGAGFVVGGVLGEWYDLSRRDGHNGTKAELT
jgi:UDP-N-acetylmuramyl pentapeptide phosphotransferase/UDP-N-acetylglucosamine-1-phosphate transferase